ncbi:hypothetical protein N7451_012590 [Penicillium sp. IBT 35674x]|nr:hypothetical protein N7451_012590 [Penicillium sp. IBT 35674x]
MFSGCSTGSLNVGALAFLKLTTEEAIELFQRTAEKVFLKEKGIVAWLNYLMRTILTGAQYDESRFRAVLNRLCGSTEIRGMRNTVTPEIVRVAIPVTDPHGSLRLVRSYADEEFQNHESLKELRNG